MCDCAGLLTAKKNHAHDGRYYLKAEVDALLENYYTKPEVDALISAIPTLDEIANIRAIDATFGLIEPDGFIWSITFPVGWYDKYVAGSEGGHRGIYFEKVVSDTYGDEVNIIQKQFPVSRIDANSKLVLVYRTGGGGSFRFELSLVTAGLNGLTVYSRQDDVSGFFNSGNIFSLVSQVEYVGFIEIRIKALGTVPLGGWALVDRVGLFP